jgi:hypothetical protein
MITSPSKSTLTGIVQFILVAVVAVSVFAVVLPVFERTHEMNVRQVQSRIANLGTALQEYCDDYDGLYPSGTYCFRRGRYRSLTGLGWAGQLYPYTHSVADFDDALGSSQYNSSSGHVVAFALNENTARNENIGSWTDRNKTVVLYQVLNARAKIDLTGEGDCSGLGACSPSGNGTMIMLLDGTTPRQVMPATGDVGGRPSFMPQLDWPAPEVDGGSFYLMADGHVKWFKPEQVSSGEFNRYNATFSTK